jgi:amidohydrolase
MVRPSFKQGMSTSTEMRASRGAAGSLPAAGGGRKPSRASPLGHRRPSHDIGRGVPAIPSVLPVPDDSWVARMVAVRRELHAHPELSWEEHETAARVLTALRQMGLSPRAGIAKTGIICDLPGDPEAPLIVLRADLDALPLVEQTGLAFASNRPGVMHACGHDGHIAMLLGAAELLLAAGLRGARVRLIFQPAEERGEGAAAMVAEGALDGVSAAYGLHLDRSYPVGTIVVGDGTVNASADAFTIRVRGEGGHAARPHETSDALLCGAAIVTALQAIVAREIDPAQAAVLTVGRFQAGTGANVIASEATLSGTLRARDPAVRRHLIDALGRVARAVGAAHRAAVEVSIAVGPAEVVNEGAALLSGRAAALQVVGPAGLLPGVGLNMGAEDFSAFLARVPGCFVRIGACPASGISHPAHSPRFDFDEAAMPIGARWLAAIAQNHGPLWLSESP